MKLNKIFKKSLAGLIKSTNRHVSERQVSEENKLCRETLRTHRNQYEPNLSELCRLYNSKEGKKYLVIDYVLISKDMEIIYYPYNWYYNHNNRRQEVCLVMLFAVLLIDNETYPLNFNYWSEPDWHDKPEQSPSQIDLAKELLGEIFSFGLEFEKVLFDAAFCREPLLKFVSCLGYKYVCRFPKSWGLDTGSDKLNAKNYFKNSYLGEFYYDQGRGFLNSYFGEYGGISQRLTIVARKKEQLVKRDFYCIISNDLNEIPTQILRQYEKRFFIEHFFKNMKSYFGLEAFYRHHPDTIISKINMKLAAYFFCIKVGQDLGKTIYRTLQYLKSKSFDYIVSKITDYWDEIAQCFVKYTIQNA